MVVSKEYALSFKVKEVQMLIVHQSTRLHTHSYLQTTNHVAHLLGHGTWKDKLFIIITNRTFDFRSEQQMVKQVYASINPIHSSKVVCIHCNSWQTSHVHVDHLELSKWETSLK